MILKKLKIKVNLFRSQDVEIWDEFISKSRNGTFLHKRSYIDYHSDRFPDSSLMIYDENNLIALLPGTIKSEIFYSHLGLTYGGLIMARDMHATYIIEVFIAIIESLKALKVSSLIYKPPPHIYHIMPCEEDLYGIHYLGAKLYRRDVSTAIRLKECYPFSKGRKASISKAKKKSLIIKRSYDFESFMKIECDQLLDKHDVTPTHSVNEIKILADAFPENIKLIAAYLNESMVGGVLTYTTNTVCHAQYIGANDSGKKLGALDMCLEEIINSLPQNIIWFDFGISTTDNGKKLDQGLLLNKESWGGRTILYDHYLLEF